MVGGTTPPQSDSGEISRVLVLNLLWQSKRCSRTAQDISVLTTPSLLSRPPSAAACIFGWSNRARYLTRDLFFDFADFLRRMLAENAPDVGPEFSQDI